MNMKKMLFREKNRRDYSIKMGSIKSAIDSRLYNKSVSECVLIRR